MQRALAVVAVAVGMCSPACVDIVGAKLDNRYVEREEKRFTTPGKPEVTLSTFDGSIEIRSWDKAEVEIIVEKRGADQSVTSEIEVQAEQSGNRISVDARIPRGRFGLHFGRSPSAKLIVTLPASSDLAAKSGDGSLDIEGITGHLELRSGDGSIRARQLGGDVTAHTGDGSITLDGKFSALNAHSGDGSIKIHAAAGSSAGGDWQITTGDGSVTLEVPDGFNGELDAHTGDGRVRVTDVTLSNVTGELERNNVRGRLGSGGHSVRVRTGDGSITLRKS